MIDRLTEEKMFNRWIPYQGEISFEEFKEKMKVEAPTQTINTKSTKEIMEDVEKILKAMGGNNGTI